MLLVYFVYQLVATLQYMYYVLVSSVKVSLKNLFIAFKRKKSKKENVWSLMGEYVVRCT